MKILIVRSFAHIVDLKTYNLQEIGMAKGLIKAGHKCDIVYYNGRNVDRQEMLTFPDNIKIIVYWLKGFSIFMNGYMPSLKHLVDDYNIVVLDSYNALMSLWAVINIPKKCIFYQGPYISRYTRRYLIETTLVDRLFYSFIDKSKVKIIAKSCIASDFVKKKGFSDTTVIGVGLNTDTLEIYDSEENRILTKQISDFKGEGILLLYVGVWEQRRNIEFLIECLKRLAENGDDYRLMLVGKNKKDRYGNRIQKMIKEYGVADRILHIDKLNQSELKACYEAADLFLFPTSYEIFGMVLLEAMYFGLPVISTYNGGSSTLINKNNGIVLKELNVELWAETIKKIATDSALCCSLSHAAYDFIIKNYTWEVMAGRILEVFKGKYNNSSMI